MEHKHEHKHEEIKEEKVSEAKKQQQKAVFIIISAVVLALLALLIFKFPPKEKGNLSMDEAKTKTEKFINDNLMMPGTKATITNIEEEYGLYKITVDVGSEESIESYVDKKGTIFYPQAFDIDTYVNPYLNEETIAPEIIATDTEIIVE
ncbi:MAG: hypothetical protein PHT84_07220 [Candidatus Pacebacteria bacterium]|nr:hypothetical protein [Candidatus Paceibacterota bacterium]